MEEQLSGSLFTPVIVAGLAYLVLTLVAQAVGARGNSEARERLLDLGFIAALLGAAWTVVLLLIAIVQESDLVYDMVVIVLVVGGFFVLLLLVLFVVFELIFGRSQRRSNPE